MALVVLIGVVASASTTVHADVLIADGDGIIPVAGSSLALGSIPCGVTSSDTALLAIQRTTNGAPNIFANGSFVAITGTGTPPGTVSRVVDAPGGITMPANWESSAQDSLSSTLGVTISVTPSAPGSSSAPLQFLASGTAANGSSITRDTTLLVTWTAGTCPTPTTTTVTCPPNLVFDGAARTPCTATVTGTGGFSQSVPIVYSNNVNVGTAVATATFAGEPGRAPSSGSASFEILAASSSVQVTCPSSVTYSGLAQEPCTAAVTGAGGLSQALTPVYSDNTVVGTASASASYPGDANHAGSSGSASFEISKAPSSVSVSCPGSVTYTGAALEPCGATVTGAGGLDESLSPVYADNVDAGTASASASYPGDANHAESSGSTTFTIAKASSTVVITCDGPKVYTGSAVQPCTARVTGAGGLDESLTPVYSNNVDAGTASVSASYSGDANHEGSSSSETFTIAKASSTVSITCDGPKVYTGSAVQPCTARVTGAGGLDAAVSIEYSDNVDAGEATASATYAGDPNHAGSSDSTTFTILPATSVVVITCDGPKVYTGSAVEPCTARVTGAGGLDESLTPEYADNVDAGTASVSASYPGDANHAGSSDSTTFTIAKASSIVSIVCGPAVYDGTEQQPCEASVTGAGGLDLPLVVEYSDNVGAGEATASASYGGDANHDGSSSSVTFTIAKAESEVNLVCPDQETFTGAAIEPCNASVTGAGTVTGNVLISYTNNTNAGVAGVSAEYPGDANHLGSTAVDTFEIGKADAAVTVLCPASVVYDGSQLEPCDASVLGAGGLNGSLPVTYSENLNAGTATASASFPGGPNHNPAEGLTTFVIAKAPSTVVVACAAGPFVFDGSAYTPCSASVSGAGGLDAPVSPVMYLDNVNAGMATASASYPGDANHEGSSGSVTFEIRKAASVVTVSCGAGPFVYDGDDHTPCEASVSGAGGLAGSLPVSYEDNVNAGTASVSASYPGDANHEGSSGSTSFEIAKAPSTVVVTCAAGPFVYDGDDHTPCEASVSGAGGLSGSVPVSYEDNVDAGMATASATYPGDANHEVSSDSASFAIAKAASLVTVACPSSVTYSGSAQTPCSASVSGAGGLDAPVSPVTYVDNVNAGTATASASYPGDANHEGSSDSATFEIAKAPSVVTVSCGAGPFVFDGTAFTPCSASVSGAGGLDAPVSPVMYVDNVNAGTATASATYPGDANHEPSSGSTTFVIAKAPSSVVVTCSPASTPFTGSPITPCTAVVTGPGGLSTSLPVDYDGNVAVGTATASAAYPGGPNHLPANNSATFEILAWNLSGFYRPVDMSTPSLRVWNTVKGGSTVPLKFEVFQGGTELTTTAAVASFTQSLVPCTDSSDIEATVELTTTGGTVLRYDSTAGQFVQNWQTPKQAGKCYRVDMTTRDGSRLTAWFKLK